MALTDNLALARRLGFFDPLRVAANMTAIARWGPNIGALVAASATRHRDRTAIVDHRGRTSFAELDRNSTELARGLRRLGLTAGDGLGLMCSNHTDFVEVTAAAAKAGVECVYLNTGFAARQLADVLEREQVSAVVVDADILPIVVDSGFGGPIVRADVDPEELPGSDDTDGFPIVAELRDASFVPLRPRAPVAPVLLTSGTTGTPKGARRDSRPSGVSSAVGLLHRIPFSTDDVTVIPTPLFHAWGLAHLTIAAATGATIVLVRRFSPEATLAAVDDEQGTVLAVVPIMLQRMLAADGLADRFDTTSLRIVASSGSALPAAVAIEWMDRFGDHLYNMYGSTEVGQATLATPDDLRAAPGTAGRVVDGSNVEVVDAAGVAVPTGNVGRIVVGNDAQFSGYTGGGTKERIRGLMSSGDVGYFDDDGRLFVTGRDDDMIVSGGENVFPQEVEELLLGLDDIVDAAVVGVPDDEFGQRLAAVVVRRDGASCTADDVRHAVSSELARHKVPRDVTFVDALPRNPTGKLLRRDL